MPAVIPPEFIDLLEGNALAHFATVRADGTPHVTPVWIDHDGDTLLVNARVDRVKAANMRSRPAVALSVVDTRNPHRFLAVTGKVVSWSENGWREHMDALSRRVPEGQPLSVVVSRRAKGDLPDRGHARLSRGGRRRHPDQRIVRTNDPCLLGTTEYENWLASSGRDARLRLVRGSPVTNVSCDLWVPTNVASLRREHAGETLHWSRSPSTR